MKPRTAHPHLERSDVGRSGLWEQGYAMGYEDGEYIGRKRADEQRLWLGFCIGVILCALIALIVIYECALR